MGEASWTTGDVELRDEIVEVRLEMLASVRDRLEEAAHELDLTPSGVAEGTLSHHLADFVRITRQMSELRGNASDAVAEEDSGESPPEPPDALDPRDLFQNPPPSTSGRTSKFRYGRGMGPG